MDKGMAASKKSSAMIIPELPHHKQDSLCTTRAPYRQGRKLTAVKVYSVNDESKYIIISHVPDIKIETELYNMCHKYGKIVKFTPLSDYSHEKFEVTYLVKYYYIKNARIAKKFIDSKTFFGGVLHVCYAPELESVEETRNKIVDRRNSVAFHTAKSKEANLKRFNPGSDSVVAARRILKRIRPNMDNALDDFNIFSDQSTDIAFHKDASSVIEEDSVSGNAVGLSSVSNSYDLNSEYANLQSNSGIYAQSKSIGTSESFFKNVDDQDSNSRFSHVTCDKTTCCTMQKKSSFDCRIKKHKLLVSNKISLKSSHKLAKTVTKKRFTNARAGTLPYQPSLADLKRPTSIEDVK